MCRVVESKFHVLGYIARVINFWGRWSFHRFLPRVIYLYNAMSYFLALNDRFKRAHYPNKRPIQLSSHAWSKNI